MTTQVTLLDYGIGNLFSVANAFEKCGAKVLVSGSVDDIRRAHHLVLPGVGAFQDGMRMLHAQNMVEAIQEHADHGKPLLGVCLGMQMLLSYSEEFGRHEGLGIIPGKVEAISARTASGQSHKIPHIGWNRLMYSVDTTKWHGTILEGISENAYMYFVHSYTAVPDNLQHRLADSFYDGCLISAAIQSGSVYGCQFHPEKSGEQGLEILRQFIKRG